MSGLIRAGRRALGAGADRSFGTEPPDAEPTMAEPPPVQPTLF
jgi:hypothetical protein